MSKIRNSIGSWVDRSPGFLPDQWADRLLRSSLGRLVEGDDRLRERVIDEMIAVRGRLSAAFDRHGHQKTDRAFAPRSLSEAEIYLFPRRRTEELLANPPRPRAEHQQEAMLGTLELQDGQTYVASHHSRDHILQSIDLRRFAPIERPGPEYRLARCPEFLQLYEDQLLAVILVFKEILQEYPNSKSCLPVILDQISARNYSDKGKLLRHSWETSRIPTADEKVVTVSTFQSGGASSGLDLAIGRLDDVHQSYVLGQSIERQDDSIVPIEDPYLILPAAPGFRTLRIPSDTLPLTQFFQFLVEAYKKRYTVDPFPLVVR